MISSDLEALGLVDEERSHRMDPLEQYKMFKRVLQRPTFDSLENAEENMRAKEDEEREFVVSSRGTHQVYQCYIQTDREGNQKWACRLSYTFTGSEMNDARDEAALAIGRELVESM